MRRTILISVLLLMAAANGVHAATITTVGSLAVPRTGPTTTLLSDGRVAVIGDDRRIEIFDPSVGRSTLTDALTPLTLRGHTATLLHDGSVLITGGGFTPADGSSIGDNYGSVDSITFEPATATVTAAGTLHALRMSHTATALHDGRVLVAGGENANAGSAHFWRTVHRSAEIYDPATRTFTPIPSMNEARSGHTATLLRDGRVLVTGGRSGDVYSATVLSSIEIFDPQTLTFIPGGSMQRPRSNHNATLLPDGRVLLIGGTGWEDSRAELFDPATNTAQFIASVGTPENGAATPLCDGRILIIGGQDSTAVFDPTLNDVVEKASYGHGLYRGIGALADKSVLLLGENQRIFRYRPEPSKPRRRAVR
jgi:hypothetical protein